MGKKSWPVEAQASGSLTMTNADVDDYRYWIGRERRFRKKILQRSLLVREANVFRSCQDCKEICLCHEDRCPNCNSDNIHSEQLLEVKKTSSIVGYGASLDSKVFKLVDNPRSSEPRGIVYARQILPQDLPLPFVVAERLSQSASFGPVECVRIVSS